MFNTSEWVDYRWLELSVRPFRNYGEWCRYSVLCPDRVLLYASSSTGYNGESILHVHNNVVRMSSKTSQIISAMKYGGSGPCVEQDKPSLQ